MLNYATRRFLLLFALVFTVTSLGIAQEKPVKHAPIQPTSPASGAEMYKAYCAVCHGQDGKGNGPAAAELKTKPADLSTLAKRHGGKFPEDYVASVLRFGVKAPAHGSSDMPTWGPLFSVVSGYSQAQVDMRISNLIRYIKSLQEK
jgi:mono/diheme cytochrome c family protein